MAIKTRVLQSGMCEITQGYKDGLEIVSFFNSSNARYIEETREVSMFDCYYFDRC